MIHGEGDAAPQQRSDGAAGIPVDEWLLPGRGRKEVTFLWASKMSRYEHWALEGKDTPGRGNGQTKDRGRT